MKILLISFYIILSINPVFAADDFPTHKYWKTVTPEQLEQSIKHGFDINAVDKNGATALIHSAQSNNNPDIISLLIKHGADVNFRITDEIGETSLMSAAENNKNPDVISRLIKHGADVNTRDRNGVTAIMRAVFNNNPDVISRLIMHGAEVNAKNKEGHTALVLATQDNNSEVINLLVKHGAEDGKPTILWVTGTVTAVMLIFFLYYRYRRNLG